MLYAPDLEVIRIRTIRKDLSSQGSLHRGELKMNLKKKSLHLTRPQTHLQMRYAENNTQMLLIIFLSFGQIKKNVVPVT